MALFLSPSPEVDGNRVGLSAAKGNVRIGILTHRERRMARDPELLAHQQWLGYLQPVGLVVSPPALLQCQAHVNANIIAEHQRFLEHVTEAPIVGRPEPMPAIKDLRALLLEVFGWQARDVV